jgi:glutathione peroxidase
MKPVHFPIKMLTLLVIFALGPVHSDPRPGLLDVEVRRLNSNEAVNLQNEYTGKVVLIVNTASKCAFTSQYEGLEALFKEYRDRGLVVLGFPSNDFGRQEPGAEAQIQNFCRLTYGVRFPMFEKTRVREGSAAPLYAALGKAAGRYPKWNFHKYLVGRDGRLAGDYQSSTSPQSRSIIDAVEALL